MNSSDSQDEKFFYIKVRFPDQKAFRFLGNGRTTRLRVHAVRWREKFVNEMAAKVREMNPGVEVQVRHAD